MMDWWNGNGRRQSYDALSDRYLQDYFTLPQVKSQLCKVGLMTKDGRILSEEEYKRATIRRQQRWAARQQLAHRMALEARDSHLARQLELQRQLQAVSSVELYRKLRGESAKQNLVSIAPLEVERTLSRSQSAPSYRSVAYNRSSAGTSIPPLISPEHQILNSSGHHTDDDRPRSELPENEENARQRRALRRRYLTELDRYQFLHRLDNDSLERFDAYLRLQLGRLERARLRPFTYTYADDDEITHVLTAVEPDAGLPEIPDRPIDSLYDYRARSNSTRPRWRHLEVRQQREKHQADAKKANIDSKQRSRSQSPNKSWRGNKPLLSRLYVTSAAAPGRRRRQPQASCECFLQYIGPRGAAGKSAEKTAHPISITQQHCGGNTINVFTGDLMPKNKFQFVSFRQRGYPFSLTFTEDNNAVLRISTCCESRFAVGTKLGGKKGLFRWLGVQNAVPCYKYLYNRCQMYRGLEAPYTNCNQKPIKKKKLSTVAAPTESTAARAAQLPRPTPPPKRKLQSTEETKTSKKSPIARKIAIGTGVTAATGAAALGTGMMAMEMMENGQPQRVDAEETGHEIAQQDKDHHSNAQPEHESDSGTGTESDSDSASETQTSSGDSGEENEETETGMASRRSSTQDLAEDKSFSATATATENKDSAHDKAITEAGVDDESEVRQSHHTDHNGNSSDSESGSTASHHTSERHEENSVLSKSGQEEQKGRISEQNESSSESESESESDSQSESVSGSGTEEEEPVSKTPLVKSETEIEPKSEPGPEAGKSKMVDMSDANQETSSQNEGSSIALSTHGEKMDEQTDGNAAVSNSVGPNQEDEETGSESSSGSESESGDSETNSQSTMKAVEQPDGAEIAKNKEEPSDGVGGEVQKGGGSTDAIETRNRDQREGTFEHRIDNLFLASGNATETPILHDAGIQPEAPSESETGSYTSSDASESGSEAESDEHSDRASTAPDQIVTKSGLTEKLKSASTALLASEVNASKDAVYQNDHNGLESDSGNRPSTTGDHGIKVDKQGDQNGSVKPDGDHGIWYCQICNFDNDLDMTKCRICGVTRPDTIAAEQQETNAQQNGNSITPDHRHHTDQDKSDHDNGPWTCRICNFDNDCELSRCRVCGVPRSSSESATTEEHRPTSDRPLAAPAADEVRRVEYVGEKAAEEIEARNKEDDEDTLADAESIRNDTSERQEMQDQQHLMNDQNFLKPSGPSINIEPPSTSPSRMSDSDTQRKVQDANQVGGTTETENNIKGHESNIDNTAITSNSDHRPRSADEDQSKTNEHKTSIEESSARNDSTQALETSYAENTTLQNTLASVGPEIPVATMTNDGDDDGGEKRNAVSATLKDACSKEDVAISNIELDTEAIEIITKLLKQNSAIRSLSIRNAHLTDDGLASIDGALLEHASQPIKAFSFSMNYLSSASMSRLIDMVQRHQADSLLLRRNNIGDEAMTSLFKALLSDNAIERLDVGENDMSKNSARALSKLLANTKTLKALSVGGSPTFDIDDWQYIAKGLMNNETLETINFDYCQMGDDALEVVCMALKNNQRLRSLDLDGNKITDRGAAAILDLLDYLPGLKTITWTAGNQISANPASMVRQVLSTRN